MKKISSEICKDNRKSLQLQQDDIVRQKQIKNVQTQTMFLNDTQNFKYIC